MLHAPAGSRTWLVVDRVARAALLVALLAALAHAAWFLARTTRHPYALDYGEGPLLDQAVRLTRGEPVYRVPGADPPWTVSNYPPVYPALEAVLVAAFGPAYWYGRLVCVVSLAGAAVLVGALVKRLTGDRFAGLVAGLLLPTVPFVGPWAALARVDLLALVLSLAGVWCVLRSQRAGSLVAAVALLALAVLTRQTYALAAPLAAVVWLAGRDRRRALGLAVGLLATVALSGLVLDVSTRGGFWFDVVTANVNDHRWAGVVYHLQTVPRQVPVLLLAALASAVVGVRHRPASARLVGPYLVAGALLVLAAGKVGSSINYLIELGTGLCLAVGVLLAWLARSRPHLLPAVLLALAAQSAWSLLVPSWWTGSVLTAMEHEAGQSEVARLVDAAAGPVLTDQEMGQLVLAGRPILLQPFELTQLSRAGRWDQRPLVASIEQQRYALILVHTVPGYPLEQDRWTAEMLAAVEGAYVAGPTVTTGAGSDVVYTPRC